MNPRSATQKGRRFELWICDMLDSCGLGPARREIGSGNGKRKGDIAYPGLKTIEAKNEVANFPQWLLKHVEQSERQDTSHDGYVLVLRDPRFPEANFRALAVLRFEDWLTLESGNREPKSKEPDRALKYKLDRLRTLLRDVSGDLMV